MNLYCFTNRRRAKDTIMLIADRYGTNDITVFTREGLVYVNIGNSVPNIDAIMHYATVCTQPLEDLLKLEEVGEIFHDDGIRRFRV